jgi:transposase
MAEDKATRNKGIINDYNAKMKLAEIAAKYGVHEQTVLSIIRKAREGGLVVRQATVRHSEISPDRNDRIVEMYKSGQTLDSIGGYFSLTRERVRQILSSRGIDRRNIGDHYRRAQERTLKQYGPLIDATFDEMRSIPKVIAKLSDASPNIPARWISKHLEPRRHESVRSYVIPKLWSDGDLLEVLRSASSGTGSITIPGYHKWRDITMFDGRKPPTVSVFCWRFGSWQNAVSTAGLASRAAFRTYKRRWTADDAISAVGRYVSNCVENASRPTFGGYDIWARTHRDCPSSAYIRLLTGMPWSQVLRAASSRVGV